MSTKNPTKSNKTHKKSKSELEDVIAIQSKKINVQKIMDSVHKDIFTKKKDYLSFLEKKIPSVIDVADDGEYLLHGWYDIDSIAGIRARWTQKKFSFFFNAKGSSHIYLEIISLPFSFIKNKNISLTVRVGKKKIEKITLSHAGVYVISIPSELQNKPILYDCELSDTFVPMEHRQGPDTRELGIAIKTISLYNTSSQSFTLMRELDDMEEHFHQNMGALQYHADPKKMLIKDHNINIFKKILLRIMDIYTRVQIVFNTYVVNQFKKEHSYIVKMLQVITSLEYEQQVHIQETEDRFSSMLPAQPKYYPTCADDFYVFQQNKLRGSYEEIKKRQQQYVPYLKTVTDINKKYPFIEAGFGRGEFIEILQENNIQNIIGVDTNSKYVEQVRKKNITVFQDDIISFMDNYKGSLSGFSAFHLLEHIPFEHLFDLLYLVKKKLAPGGVVIAETPNVENLVVGSCTFYYDHTHKTKLSPVFLRTIFEYLEFSRIQVKTLTPVHKTRKNRTEELLFGPQDFAIIAWKS